MQTITIPKGLGGISLYFDRYTDMCMYISKNIKDYSNLDVRNNNINIECGNNTGRILGLSFLTNKNTKSIFAVTKDAKILDLLKFLENYSMSIFLHQSGTISKIIIEDCFFDKKKYDITFYGDTEGDI